ncbi:hypothetical protein AB0F43_06200 [Kribbella sp. NPDC023972]|uniref:hypothetical protein n=1 Tax=Kribbella sp. NPDC023972 TaxID=3154795 RepID=UPI0033CB1E16
MIIGRIGFVNENEIRTVFFDPDEQDFVRGVAPSGVIVPFAVRLGDGLIAFQLRPGVVRTSSFTGALEALLNDPTSEYLWNIKAAVQAEDWQVWSRRVSRITAFKIRLDRPNPHYGDDDKIESVIEGIRVEYMRLSGVALDEGINLDDDLFRQAVNHVLRNYGRASISGVEADGSESTWIKLRDMVASVVRTIRIRAVGDREVPDEVLAQVTQTVPGGQTAADLHELDPANEG